MKLDSKAIAKCELEAKADGKADVIYFDDDLAGFGLRLRGKRKTWIAQYRSKGRTRRMKIGSVEKIDAAAAREAAKEILANVVLGKDPQGDKAATRLGAARTFKSIAASFLDAKKAELRPASMRVTRLYLTGSYFKPLHPNTITDVTRADVAACLRTVSNRGRTVAAAQARSAVNTMFAWAMGEGLVDENPVIGTNKPKKSDPRERVLTDDELGAVWRACGDQDFGKIVKLLMLTGCRRLEIGGLRRREFDADTGTLTLPAERVKNKRKHVLPLPQLAIAIIQSLPEGVDDDRDNYFGLRSRAGFTDWTAPKASLDDRLGRRVARWTIHDLRRSVATGMATLGIQPHVVVAVLNHYSGHRAGVAGVYNRSPYEKEVRAALALWADHVRSIVEGGEHKIVSFPTSKTVQEAS
jgi:integrase